MLNGIKESKLTKLICGLMLASMALSFSRGIFGSTYNVANSKPNKPANRVLSKASINRKQKVTVASPVIMKQANSKQANSRRNSVKSNIQNMEEKMRLLDDPEETKSGMYLSLLADEPGEAEAAMVLNSLVDDPDELVRETFQYQDDNKPYSE